MRSYVFGCGQGATKAMITCIENGVFDKRYCRIVNSTNKDIPKEYVDDSNIIISPNTSFGCGKIREKAYNLMMDYLRENSDDLQDDIAKASPDYVHVISTTEGASGSGASIALAKWLSFLEIPVIITVISGFETDTKGIQNTINYFKDLGDANYTVISVSNKKFKELNSDASNVFIAEKGVNTVISDIFKTIELKEISDSDQNIDDMDHIKIITNPGLMVCGEAIIPKSTKNQGQMDALISNAIDNNISLDFTPSATRIGIFMNISDDHLEAIDTDFNIIKKKLCGSNSVPELFVHKQYDASLPEFIRFIASGIDLPAQEIIDMYNRFQSETPNVGDKKSFSELLGDIEVSGDTFKSSKFTKKSFSSSFFDDKKKDTTTTNESNSTSIGSPKFDFDKKTETISNEQQANPNKKAVFSTNQHKSISVHNK